MTHWARKGRAILLFLYLALSKRPQGDRRAFIESAYQLILKRSADESGLNSFMNLLERGVPRWVVIEVLLASDEYRWVKNKCSPYDILHSLRCQLVRQLPPAEMIVDLGGAASPALEGALLWMGYPHQPREITIIDLPPDIRMFANGFTHLRAETPGWLVFGPTRVRYLHQSMADLTGVANESVDLVWSGESIEHITLAEAAQMFQEIWRVLKPGGYFCLDTPNRNVTQIQSPNQLIHPEHKLEYTAPQLTNYLAEAGFQVKQVMGLAPMPQAVQSGVFNWLELMDTAGFSDNAEICYLFYVQCVKPGSNP